MKECIITLIIAIFVWQSICVAMYFTIFNESEDKTLIFATALPCLLLLIISTAYRKLYFTWCKRNLNGYRFFFTDDNGNVYSNSTTYYMTDEIAETLYHRGENDKFIEKTSCGSTWKSAPYKQDIYKGEDKFRGYDMKLFSKI